MVTTRVMTGLLAALLVTTGCREDAVAPAGAEPLRSEAALTGGPGAQRTPFDPIARILGQAAELGLSQAQVAELTAIQSRLAGQVAPLREQVAAILGEAGAQRPRPGQMSDAEREAWRAKMERARPLLQQVRESTRAAMREARAVLTAEQQAKLRESSPRRGARGDRGTRGGHGPFAGAADPVGRILGQAAELGLSQAQVAELTAIQSRLAGQVAPLREQVAAILGEAGAQRPRPGQMSDAEREAWRAKMERARPLLQQVRESTRAAMKEARAVLTAEQQAKLRELSPRGRVRGPGMRPGR